MAARCSQGDRQAFDVLWERYRQRIFTYLCLRVRNPHDAEDLAQETFIRAWSALSRGTRVETFVPYLYQVARNLANDWSQRCRRVGVLQPLEEQQEIPSQDPSVEQTVDATLSSEFLMKQLDEVLLAEPSVSEEGWMGLLRKLAFVSFYMDGLTVLEIQASLASHAQALGLVQPTATQLNNWLSRGDILCSLVRHLVQDHPAWILATTWRCLSSLNLPVQELELARLRWQEGLPLETIAERTGQTLAQVSAVLEKVARRLVPAVSASLKATLHDARRRD
ncbi:MAG: RNA polymerase sigma factor [Chloroflexi bacterium]|nr:RNA polymerase sigma factor [Chloroflexota bacterium]